jgi:hypothetical protein
MALGRRTDRHFVGLPYMISMARLPTQEQMLVTNTAVSL